MLKSWLKIFKTMENQKKLPKQEFSPERRLPKPSFLERVIEFFRCRVNKRNIIIIVVMLAVMAGAIGLRMTILKPTPKQIYQAAVMVRSQVNKDKSEDLRVSLKKGDVLVVQDADHKFSKMELVSYLILKMKLNKEQAAKLIQADIRPRLYFIDLSKRDFAKFQANDLLKGQPFQNKVYGWEIVDKKK